MDDETDGAGEALEARQGQQGDAQDEGQPQADADGGEAQAQVNGSADYQRALAAKDAEIEALRGKVAEAAKSAEATEALNAQIAELKAQMEDERVEFALRSAGARNVKAARALLGDYEGDVTALAEGEPWMFAQVAGGSQKGSQAPAGGATGLEPAGASGGSGGAYMGRWERIAGLATEGKGE